VFVVLYILGSEVVALELFYQGVSWFFKIRELCACSVIFRRSQLARLLASQTYIKGGNGCVFDYASLFQLLTPATLFACCDGLRWTVRSNMGSCGLSRDGLSR
jgi:hypothetical protein